MRAKFFGKKKNAALAEEKEREAKTLQEKIKENEAKVKEAYEIWKSGDKSFKQESNDLERQISEWKGRRSAYYKEIDRWVCIAGPDCINPPQEDPEAIKQRQRAEASAKAFAGATPMEANNNMKRRVYEVLQREGRLMTVSDIIEADSDLSGLSNMKISALANWLVDDGLVEKVAKERRSYYRAK